MEVGVSPLRKVSLETSPGCLPSPHLYLFKGMLYANSEVILAERCALATVDPIALKYANYGMQITAITKRRAEWSLVDRMDLSTTSNATIPLPSVRLG